MEFKQKQSSKSMIKSSNTNEPVENFFSSQSFSCIDSQDQKWGLSSSPPFDSQIEQPFAGMRHPPVPTPALSFNSDHQMKRSDQCGMDNSSNSLQDWDPRLMLSNLSFLEEKVHQLQGIVLSIINREDASNDVVAHQQLATTDLTSIIIQLISTAGTLLPSAKGKQVSACSNPSTVQLSGIVEPSTTKAMDVGLQSKETIALSPDSLVYECRIKDYVEEENYVNEVNPLGSMGDHEGKEYEDIIEEENLPPGSYEVLQLEKDEILAPHTHFCSICGKGFKRDANLRMHMRGHGDEYKTPAALSKPAKDSNSETLPVKRYSCPYLGCKRNKDHKKFQPLKTILCVKNHYKRSHCDKSYTCSRCKSKKFSVIADLKTHEKHCGRDKWLCSCGTTFSRKDKLFGHVALFQGHAPVLTLDETKGSGAPEHLEDNVGMKSIKGSKGFEVGSSRSNCGPHILEAKGADGQEYFSSINFNACNFGGIDEFPQPGRGVPGNMFSFIPSGSCNFAQKGGGNSSSSVL